MNPYETLISIIREQNKIANTIRIGKMKEDKICAIGDLELSGDDLLVAEYLKTGYYTEEQGKQVYIHPLQKGDLVGVCKVDQERYIIVGRLVDL